MIMFLIRVLVCFIPYRPWRKTARSVLFLYHADMRFRKLNDKSFFSANVAPKTVLLVEPNECHGVVIPGFVKYFQELGYSVDVLIRHGNAGEMPFGRTPKSEWPRIFKGSSTFIRSALCSSKAAEYDLVFITTSTFYENGMCGYQYLRFLKRAPKTKNGIMLVQHDLDKHFALFGEQRYLEENRLFTLLGFQNTPMLNPHYFGPVDQALAKNACTQFIIIGGISQEARNYHELVETVSRFVENGQTNFRITVIGNGTLPIPEEIQNHVSIKGFLPFPELYSELEKADFILYLLDWDIQGHKRYLNSSCTGTALLAYGFAKPGLISDTYNKNYRLTADNSIIYRRKELFDAMQTAIAMDEAAYARMKANMAKTAKTIYSDSLENLRAALNAVVNSNGE